MFDYINGPWDKFIQVDMILNRWRAERANGMGIYHGCVKAFPSKSKTKHIV